MRPYRLLFITPYVPSRLRTRPFHFLRGLAERGHRVTLCAVATTAAERADAAALAGLCERVEVVPVATAYSLWRCMRGLGGPLPLQARYCHSPVMAARIRQALAAPLAFDLVHVEHLRAALYGLDLRQSPPRLYDAVDCMSRLVAQTAARGPSWRSRATARAELTRTRRLERAAVERFDRVLLTSETERTALLGLGETAAQRHPFVHALPNGVDLDHFAPRDVPREAANVVFVGRMGYHANLAAAYALLDEVMPRIWTQRPDTRLLIVGAEPPAALRGRAARARGPVTVTGTVPDVRPYLAQATLSLIPLPYAVGIQNKVLEAMAMATPVVASPAARAALRATPGVDLLVDATADGLAAQALRLLDDPSLARRIGGAGRRYVERHHDWRRIVSELEEIYAEMIVPTRPAPARLACEGSA